MEFITVEKGKIQNILVLITVEKEKNPNIMVLTMVDEKKIPKIMAELEPKLVSNFKW